MFCRMLKLTLTSIFITDQAIMLKLTHVTDHSKLRQHFENLEPDADVFCSLSYSPPGEDEMNFYATSGRKIEFFYLSLITL